MVKNIPWNSLTGSQVQELVRMWPEQPEWLTRRAKPTKPAAKPASVPTPAPVAPKKTKEVKPSTTRGRKHIGRDGEVKFLEHRNIWIGFFGGRAVVKRNSKEACREALKKTYNVELVDEKG